LRVGFRKAATPFWRPTRCRVGLQSFGWHQVNTVQAGTGKQRFAVGSEWPGPVPPQGGIELSSSEPNLPDTRVSSFAGSVTP